LIYIGHEGEISKVNFNPQGTKIVTASSDQTAKIWNSETGDELQTLAGIFLCI
jgi:dynein assembly factor with WDR repeat domains 1